MIELLVGAGIGVLAGIVRFEIENFLRRNDRRKEIELLTEIRDKITAKGYYEL